MAYYGINSNNINGFGVNPNSLSFSSGSPLGNSFASGLGSDFGSVWNSTLGGYSDLGAGGYQPLNYDLSSGMGLGNTNSTGFFNFDSPGFFNWDLGSLQGAMGALGSAGQFISGIGNLVQGINASKLAKKQFNFMKNFANTQMDNAIKEYNTKLAGKYRSQSYYETGHDGAFDDLYEQNKLTR